MVNVLQEYYNKNYPVLELRKFLPPDNKILKSQKSIKQENAKCYLFDPISKHSTQTYSLSKYYVNNYNLKRKQKRHQITLATKT